MINDDDFVQEYSQYTSEEQQRRLSLVTNISDEEFARRLSLLSHKHDEIIYLARRRGLPLFDQINLYSTSKPQIFDKVTEPGNSSDEEFELKPKITEEPFEDMADALQQLLQGQQDQNKALAEALASLAIAIGTSNTSNDNKLLRAEDVYEFKPSDSPNNTEYFLFCERIADLTGQFGDTRVRSALISCLKNQRAKTWYTSLTDEDKQLLTGSTESWRILLKRDFGIHPARALILSQNEKFSFVQARPILRYFNAKLAWLKIAGVENENNQCVQICEGLLDPEYRSVIRLAVDENTLQHLRADLLEMEADMRAVWNKTNRPASRPFPNNRFRDQQRTLQTPVTTQKADPRGS